MRKPLSKMLAVRNLDKYKDQAEQIYQQTLVMKPLIEMLDGDKAASLFQAAQGNPNSFWKQG